VKIFPRYPNEDVAKVYGRLVKRLGREGWRAEQKRHEYFLTESQRRRMTRDKKKNAAK
jgi:hypothetical protein